MLRKLSSTRFVSRFAESFGVSNGAACAVLALFLLTLPLAAYCFFHFAPPKTLVMTAGPADSTFAATAAKYAGILARDGVKLTILNSRGSEENLARLAAPGSKVDVGFVQGGVTNPAGGRKIYSLGSVAHQPLMIFHPAKMTVPFLGDFAGKRLALGPEGSGSRALALPLLATNGIVPGGATALLDLEPEAAVKALMDGSADAVFLMTDSVSSKTLRQLMRNPAFKLFDFSQAAAYVRRFPFLDRLDIPQGAFDFAKNIPAQDVHLVGPTVDLVVGADLHPALSDLLLEAAREIHGNPSLLQRRGEFPAPLEHEIQISPDAQRFYKTGKSFLYRRLPFWLAGMVERTIAVILPMALLLIPGLKLIPTLLKFRMKLVLFRWYRELIALERGLFGQPSPENRAAMLQRLQQIESAVKTIKVPASQADQFYALRGHIHFVREKLHESGLDRAQST